MNPTRHEFTRFEIYLINLDPTTDSEIRKTRPCVVISPDEMNKHLNTVIIAPLTSSRRNYPSRINLTFQGKKGQIVLDQIRTVDQSRLIKRLGTLTKQRAMELARTLTEMFAF
ncbi:MAG: type II toxin-antitoxin system PemK/MazF family toxin [Wenzhouxiangella sp.]|nr:type II toxin-antitoxin system PemK/MazF family toxin [Wenzhouxiangella sp.]